MRTFFKAVPEIYFNRRWSNFDDLYPRLLPFGLTMGFVLFGIGLAYSLVYLSPLVAVLMMLAVPAVIALITRPQLGLLLVIFAIAFEEFGAVLPGISALKLLSVMVYGGAIVHFLVFRRRDALVNVGQNWLILLFVGGIVLSNFAAWDSARTLDRTGRLLRVLTLYLIAINLVRTRKSLISLIWVFIIAGFISAGWGLLDPAQAGQRLYGTMGQPNDFAAAMIPRLALALCLLKVEIYPLRRGILLVMIVVIAYAAILSGSRGGLIGMLLALVLFALTQKNRVMGLTLVSLVVVLGLLVMPLPIKQRIGLAPTVRGGEELAHSTDRRETYQLFGWELWQENPVFGVGLDGFASVYAQSEYRFLQRNQLKRVAHNTYLEIGVGTGLVGFIPFVLLLGWSLYRAWQLTGSKETGSTGIQGVSLRAERSNLHQYQIEIASAQKTRLAMTYSQTPPEIPKSKKTFLYPAEIAAGLFAAQGGYFLSMLFGSRQYDKTLWLLIAMVVIAQQLIKDTAGERTLTQTAMVSGGP